ncbi:MAG: CCA tRNA nucleotidyltransferase [Lachnospiraceae bacterium]|nr:CCA tRNA nucleotidyltransferase [Lachnospiraceae bacterium]
MKLEIPRDVEAIIHILEEAGYEAYAVGGCVRDAILGREPNDWDITTSAMPEEVKALFSYTIDTGIEHGTVTIMMHKIGYEVTTYRIDGKYSDHRHPEEVTFTRSLEEDLKRRDFTINAMAYNERSGLVDLFGGQSDLKEGVIRAVGLPRERFSEDALRMMRAVRFAAQLGFSIEPETAEAVKALAPTIKDISAERIQVELVKLLESDHPERMRTLYELGITAVIMPEFDRMMETEQHNPHHMYTVGEHSIRATQAIRADKVLRLAMLFHDIAKPITKTTDEAGIDHFHGHPQKSAEMAHTIMRRLKFDNASTDLVARLCRYHDRNIEPNPRAMRRALHEMGEDLFPVLFTVKQADMEAQSTYKREEKQKLLDEMEACYLEVIKAGDPVNLGALCVKGKDLMEWGMKPGPQLGVMLKALLDEVIEDPARNTKEELKKLYEAKKSEIL